MNEISSEQVRSLVRKFWAILTGASKDKIEDLYSSDAIVFTGSAKRSDPAKLVSIRRTRQRTGAGSGSKAEVGSIEVQVVGSHVAIATYTYQFHSSAIHGDGSRVQTHTQFGRATQVFRQDENGNLHIVHEHLSSAAPAKVEKTTRQ
jgi:ketosteroid isomerase-like protein